MDILFDGLSLDPCGFGVVNRNILRELRHSKNVKLNHTILPKNKHLIPKQHLMELTPLEKTNISRAAPAIISYPTGFSLIQKAVKNLDQSRYVVFLTMTEVSELNKNIIQEMNYADEIWVPTEFDLNKFKKYHDRVFKISLFSDHSVYNKSIIPNKDIRDACRGFVFMFCGSGIYRKGLLEACKSYTDRFSDSDDVTLLILSKEINLTQIYDKLQLTNRSNLPHIHIIDKYIHENQIPSIYACADVLVLPSRGEGWSLPAIEFAYMGKPAIMPRYGGQLEFLDDSGSWLVDVDEYSKDGLMYELYKTEQYKDVEFPVFNEKFLDNLSKYMHEAFTNRKLVSEKGEYIFEKTKQFFNRDVGISAINFRLEEIQKEIESGYIPRNIVTKRDKDRIIREEKFQNFKYAIQTKKYFSNKENIKEHFLKHYTDLKKFIIVGENTPRIKLLPNILSTDADIHCDFNIFDFSESGFRRDIMDIELAKSNVLFYYDAWVRYRIKTKQKTILGTSIDSRSISHPDMNTLMDIVNISIIDEKFKSTYGEKPGIYYMDFANLAPENVDLIKSIVSK